MQRALADTWATGRSVKVCNVCVCGGVRNFQSLSAEVDENCTRYIDKSSL